MNRRDFARRVTGTALGAAALAAGRRSASALAMNGNPVPEGTGGGLQISVMLWTVYRDLPFEQRLEKMAEAGYSNVELVGEYHQEKWTEDRYRQVNRKRRELHISFDTTAGLPHGVGDPSAREALLADLKAELPIMETLECPACIVMSGNVVPGMPRAKQHESCIEGLKRAGALVEGKTIAGQPVRLLLENIDPEENPKYYLQSVAEGFEIIKAVNHPQVRFLYDFFHEQIAEGNLIEKLEKNIDQVGLVHIADVPGRHEPGTGEINYENIFRVLGKLKYDRIAAMEFLPTGDPIAQLRTAKEMALRAAQAGRMAM